ncbi:MULTISPECIES: DUF4150 domain-containing protein [unclassified Mesorhizobium]|uniref:DUF4150 domain-containing protein n=1 Tax=unclassified Mesorhizobium TaxID=325217 RepID=UPI001FD96B35|nr:MULTISPECIES: DUF4150 domain-containing protein [unclassified Mesorhizobium]MDG4855857.1 DUF4150 domain-containing protein [Mesorhizobium sp. WSM4982]MDG4910651.1 DUF4150 domain-containing protein [Mesorhizobium sp. WSM4898]MDG4915435.1 DUF4150 domain-containing protein [Mesorhizobium sp. WSM4983]
MSNVFANGLEISGKAVNAQTIAAFPDVCFTPPENPATPPGVPIPYPSFGMASDTEQGTSTVKIGGKTVNIKNKSDLSKTSGTEAGCAAKKGVITSKNTGKEYFNSWSNNVKFDGEPVIRNTDLATNNHASPIGNTPPWVHIASLSVGGQNCLALLASIDIHVHPYDEADNHCKKGKQQSDHVIQNAFFEPERGGGPIGAFPRYTEGDAPCICLNDGKKKTTQHGKKSRKQIKRAAAQRRAEGAGKSGACSQTYEEARDAELQHTAESLPKLAASPDAQECLKAICDTYFKWATRKRSQDRLNEVKCDVPKV